MIIKDRVLGDAYKNLISYTKSRCNIVRFTLRNDGFGVEDNKLLSSLKEDINLYFKDDIINIIRNDRSWNNEHGYSEDVYYEFYFIKYSDNVKKYLLNNMDLYNWMNPKYPEDISFFIDDYCWLYSITHEQICNIFCEDEKEYEYLKSIGIEFVDNMYVKHSPSYECYQQY